MFTPLGQNDGKRHDYSIDNLQNNTIYWLHSVLVSILESTKKPRSYDRIGAFAVFFHMAEDVFQHYDSVVDYDTYGHRQA